jgi:hypothetical protein
MSDWADEKAMELLAFGMDAEDVADVAAALRQARIDALVEAASPQFLRPLVEEQAGGEWDDRTIDEDVAFFSTAILALKEKQP